jgi:hypothetical protein
MAPRRAVPGQPELGQPSPTPEPVPALSQLNPAQIQALRDHLTSTGAQVTPQIVAQWMASQGLAFQQQPPPSMDQQRQLMMAQQARQQQQLQMQQQQMQSPQQQQQQQQQQLQQQQQQMQQQQLQLQQQQHQHQLHQQQQLQQQQQMQQQNAVAQMTPAKQAALLQINAEQLLTHVFPAHLPPQGALAHCQAVLFPVGPGGVLVASPLMNQVMLLAQAQRLTEEQMGHLKAAVTLRNQIGESKQILPQMCSSFDDALLRSCCKCCQTTPS